MPPALYDPVHLFGDDNSDEIGMNDETQPNPEDPKRDEPLPGDPQAPAAAEPNQGESLPEEDVAEEVEGTDKAITELESELLQVKDQMLRAVAEAENIRKRAQKQTEDAHKYANSNFAKSLLSVADNLRRAIEAVPEDQSEGDELVRNLIEGVGAVERELLSAFQQNGIEKVEPLDQPFDPNFHQAMFEIETPDKDPGTIVQLVAPGYVLNGRLLRAAMVAIAKAPDQRRQRLIRRAHRELRRTRSVLSIV